MNVRVLSRKDLMTFSRIPTEYKFAAISITDPDKKDVSVKLGRTGIGAICRVRFFDEIEDKHWCIMQQDAEQIADFAYKMAHRGDIEALLVQCEAGISRSSGVAAAILKWMTGSDKEIFSSYRYVPNMTCYRRVLEALYAKGEPPADRKE